MTTVNQAATTLYPSLPSIADVCTRRMSFFSAGPTSPPPFFLHRVHVQRFPTQGTAARGSAMNNPKPNKHVGERRRIPACETSALQSCCLFSLRCQALSPLRVNSERLRRRADSHTLTLFFFFLCSFTL